MTVEQGAVEKFLENYQRVVDSAQNLNEADTKRFLIDPLLNTLGWDFIPDQIEAEYAVDIGTGTKHVDYCLKIDGSPVAFLEAKAYGRGISRSELKQALSYGRVEYVRWCFVTNGERFVVLDADSDARTVEDSEAFEFDVPDLDDYPHYLETLSPAGLAEGKLEDLAEDLLDQRQLLSGFAEDRDDIRETVVDLIEPFTGTEDGRQLADDFLNRVRASIERERGSPSPAPDPQPASTSQSPSTAVSFQPTRRADLPADGDALVAVFPANPDGLEFIRHYGAWGFVRLARSPSYCAIYVTKPRQELLLVSKIDEVMDASDWANQQADFDRDDYGTYDPQKSVVTFETGKIFELDDPIPWKEGDPILQGLRYTTLESLKSADRIKGLASPE